MAYKTPNELSDKIRKLLPPENDEVIKEMLIYAENKNVPILLPESVAFLRQLIRLSAPKRILEVGTAIGFSGQVMLNECSGHLFTIELDMARALVAKEFFLKAAKLARKNEMEEIISRATVYIGDAADVLKSMSGQFDFVFLDGAKSQYINYIQDIKRLMKKGALLLCDNVLFSPKKEFDSSVKITEKLDGFLQTLFGDREFLTSLLPVGDGMSLSIKQ